MFWVIFDTATRRDYYRDVHKILALPAGGICRYDYKGKYFSPKGLEHAEKRPANVDALLVYVQPDGYQKGGDDPVGPVKLDSGLWVGTRLATVRTISRPTDRYYLYLQMRGYPSPNEQALRSIMHPLVEADEVPFSNWVSVSELDEQYQALCQGDSSDNWAAIQSGQWFGGT